jgi:AAA15 family ATPase/GTPase
MIRHVAIENFRAFAKTKLDGLSQVNIVLGDNGSGKTSFLEAIFLASAASPEFGVQLKQIRGLQVPPITQFPIAIGQQEQFQAFWADFFRDFTQDKRIEISLEGPGNGTRGLSIYTSSDQNLVLPLGTSTTSPSQAFLPVTFEWKVPNSQPYSVTPQIGPLGFQFTRAPDSTIRSTYIPAHMAHFGKSNADNFSYLSKQNREKEVVDAIIQQFPDVTAVSNELSAGAYVLHVSTKWKTRKIPLTLYSDGAEKIAAIILGASYARDGVVCVDQIEDGIHYSRHRGMWESVKRFTTTFSSQVFASTHSIECLKAAAEVFQHSPEKLCLVQISQERGTSEALSVAGKDAIAAIHNDIELRR